MALCSKQNSSVLIILPQKVKKVSQIFLFTATPQKKCQLVFELSEGNSRYFSSSITLFELTKIFVLDVFKKIGYS